MHPDESTKAHRKRKLSGYSADRMLQWLKFSEGNISMEQAVVKVDSHAKLRQALQNPSLLHFNDANPEECHDEKIATKYYTIVCLNAPWTKSLPESHPQVHEVQQKVIFCKKSLPKAHKFLRVDVDCAQLENAVEICDVSSRLPCIQVWCNGQKYSEKPWRTASHKAKNTQVRSSGQFSVPLPLELPFKLPLMSSNASNNRRRLLQRGQEGQSKTMQDGDKYTALVISASWCAPCQKLKGFLKSLIEDYKDSADFILCDYDEYPEVREFYGVQKIPSIVVTDRLNGSMHGVLQHSDETKIRYFLDQTMKIFRLDEDF